MQQQPRRLVLVRHSKADQAGPTDFERRLTERGRADAAALGAWLAGRGLVPEHALVSAADRARETWECLAGAAGWGLTPDLDRGLYAAGPETALDLVRAVPGSVATLVVVGHNPTVASLASVLDDGEGDPAATSEMLAGYPTSAATVLALAVPWTDLAEGGARVEAFHVGRG